MVSEKSCAATIAVALLCILVVVPSTESIAVMSLDLGSEWIKIAIVKPGVPMEIALNKESRRKTPNVVAFKDNERHFSDPALSVSVKSPEKSYLYLNHLLGKKFESPYVELYKSRFPHYNVVKDDDRGTATFKSSDDKSFSPEELMAMILNNSRQIAENFADHPMKDLVITVPAFLNQAERKAILNSAKMVGLNVLQLMNDNTAVALNYGIFRAASFNATETHVLFYDMGATSTTATIVGYSTVKTKDRGFVETVPQLAVKGVGFDPLLGGLEMELRLRTHLVSEFKNKIKTEKDIAENPRAMMKLLKEASRVKRILSANTDTFAQVENLFEGHDFRCKVTREIFETLCKDLFERVASPVETALRAAAMKLDHIDAVLLMGGGTRVPKVQELLRLAVKREELGKSINTDEAAALGAVYRAADLTTGFKVKRFLIKDVNMYPVDVSFHRRKSPESGEEGTRVVTRTLFHRLNPIPQKKVMTFNKQERDFKFNVTYGDTSIFTADIKRFLDLGSLREVDLSGVATANNNNKDAQAKGIKAFFNMDDSGILSLDKVEAHFEKKAEDVKEEEQSTFAKIGSTLSSLFGSSKGEEEKKDDTSKEEEQKQEEKPHSDKDKAGEKTKDDKTAEDKKTEEKKPEGKEEKKTDENKKEEKNDGKKEDKKDDKTENKTADAKDANATAGNKTAEKPQPAKPVLVKENISLTMTETDIPTIGENTFAASVKLLDELHKKDLAKAENERAKNSLETFLYEFRDKLDGETIEELSSEGEREKIRAKFSEISDWIDEEGFDSTADVYKSKLKELESATDDLRFRMIEHEFRPKAIKELLSSLNLTNVFMKQLTAMPESKEIYSEKDIKDLEKVAAEVTEWLGLNWKRQNETDPKTKPVMLVKDIKATQGKLDRELLYLINKAKYYVPKPKPKANTTAENKTTSANDTKEKSDSEKSEKKKDDKKETTEKQSDKKDGEAADKKTVGNNKDEKSKATEKEGDSSDEVKPLELPAGDSKEKQEKTKTEGKKENEQKKSEETKNGENKSSKDKDAKAHKEL
eukprot:Seg2425.2 transcript_id=Seg2425.2/GoldUCD/mRNA.D3Y31 product="Hypoxia up-regulated protein 1" protein_id=Seg2425.2/GoldUCD/D3Y31